MSNHVMRGKFNEKSIEIKADANREGGVDFSKPIYMKMQGSQGMYVQPGLNDNGEVDFSKPINITMEDGTKISITSPIDENGQVDLNRLKLTDAYKLTNLAVKQYFGDESMLGSIVGSVLGAIAGIIAMSVHAYNKASGAYYETNRGMNEYVNNRINQSMKGVTPEGVDFLIKGGYTCFEYDAKNSGSSVPHFEVEQEDPNQTGLTSPLGR